MRTFQQFVEATESDVRAMGGTDSQIAALKKRQEKRGYGFQGNDDRNPSAPKKTQSPGLIGTKERTPVERQAPKPSWDKGSGKGYPKAKNTGALATTPKPKSSAPTTSTKPAAKPQPQSRGGALATTGSSSLATTPKSKGGALAKTGEVTPPPTSGSAKIKSDPYRMKTREATPKPKKQQKQPINYRKHVDSAVKTAGKVGKYASGLAKSTRGKVGDSKASPVQGSSEIIRGSRS